MHALKIGDRRIGACLFGQCDKPRFPVPSMLGQVTAGIDFSSQQTQEGLENTPLYLKGAELFLQVLSWLRFGTSRGPRHQCHSPAGERDCWPLSLLCQHSFEPIDWYTK